MGVWSTWAEMAEQDKEALLKGWRLSGRWKLWPSITQAERSCEQSACRKAEPWLVPVMGESQGAGNTGVRGEEEPVQTQEGWELVRAWGPRGQFPALTFQAERSPTCSGGFGENNMKYQWIGLNLGLNQRPSSTQLWRGQKAVDTEKQNWKYSIPQFYFSVIWKNTTMVWFWW